MNNALGGTQVFIMGLHRGHDTGVHTAYHELTLVDDFESERGEKKEWS